MPLTSKTFSQLIDFTRTSAATYVDQLGRIVPTPVSPNQLTFTQELDNAAWTKVGATVAAGDILAPDGTRTAEKVVETAVSSRHGVKQSVVSVAAPYTLTVYARPAENTFLALSPGGSGQTNAFTWFNLVTGAVGTNNNPLAAIESVGGGWYRCSITFMAISGTLTPLVEMAKSNNTNRPRMQT